MRGTIRKTSLTYHRPALFNDGAGDGAATGGGDGAPATGTTTAPPEGGATTTAAPAAGSVTDLGDAGKKAIAEERKARQAAEKALAELQRQHMNDNEKAIADAKIAGKAEAAKELGGKLVAAHLKAALVGKAIEKPEDFLKGINSAGFLTDDGDVDEKAIEAWAKTLPDAKPVPRRQTLDGGHRTTAPTKESMSDLMRAGLRR